MKRCSRCSEIKPISSFYRNQAMPDGHQYYCKPCSLEANRPWQINKRPRWALAVRWEGTVVTTEEQLRRALTLPEPFYALQSTKEK